MIAGCQRQGKAAGTLMFDAAQLRPWIAKGMRFVAYSSDVTLLADAAAKAVGELRGMR
jgi:2-keto-3-deoxy-L-rhamnonate aldolase RhmA